MNKNTIILIACALVVGIGIGFGGFRIYDKYVVSNQSSNRNGGSYATTADLATDSNLATDADLATSANLSTGNQTCEELVGTFTSHYSKNIEEVKKENGYILQVSSIENYEPVFTLKEYKNGKEVTYIDSKSENVNIVASRDGELYVYYDSEKSINIRFDACDSELGIRLTIRESSFKENTDENMPVKADVILYRGV